jgi:hypothetical protein
MPVGTCRLCQSRVIELRDSHILPKWAYKRIRSDSDTGNPNPVRVTGEKAFQTSKQVSEYMLCSYCEQRIGNTEDYVASLAYTTEGNPGKLMRRILPPDFNQNSSVPSSVSLKQLSTDKIVFFASSVVWRACVTKYRSIRKPSLGKKYEAAIREYLDEKKPFPKNARVIMSILDPQKCVLNDFHNLVTFPLTHKEDGYHRHSFFICGIYFELCLGNVLPQFSETMCLYHGNEKLIPILAPNKIGLFQDIAKQVKNVARSKKFL